jgi:hypothetical protein
LGRPIDGAVPLGSVVNRFSLSHGLNFAFVNFVARYDLLVLPQFSCWMAAENWPNH